MALGSDIDAIVKTSRDQILVSQDMKTARAGWARCWSPTTRG
jgi:hypothetical protein